MPKIASNQPVFTDHGTFIICFSVARNHLAVAPERAGINYFSDEIVLAGNGHTKEFVRIQWDSPAEMRLESILVVLKQFIHHGPCFNDIRNRQEGVVADKRHMFLLVIPCIQIIAKMTR